MWAYGIRCPAMVSSNASQHKEDKLLYPDHYLVWYAKVDSGPHMLDGISPVLFLRFVSQLLKHRISGMYLSICHTLLNPFTLGRYQSKILVKIKIKINIQPFYKQPTMSWNTQFVRQNCMLFVSKQLIRLFVFAVKTIAYPRSVKFTLSTNVQSQSISR